MSNNYAIAEWAGWKREDGEWWSVPGIGRKANPPDLAASVALDLWHSILFPLIEARDMQDQFINEVTKGINPDNEGFFDLWLLLKATPAQLTEALVRVIEEGDDAETT